MKNGTIYFEIEGERFRIDRDAQDQFLGYHDGKHSLTTDSQVACFQALISKHLEGYDELNIVHLAERRKH